MTHIAKFPIGNVRMRWNVLTSCKASFSSRMAPRHESYQYLEKSRLPTMHFQDSLLRLGIPELKDTCDRYLRTQKAILNDEEFARAATLIADFQANTAPSLQKELIAYDKENLHTSYISKPWSDMYLEDRVPLMHNYNPFFAFQPETDAAYNNPVIRASNLIISSMRFMRSLREEVLSPEVYHLNPKTNQSSLYEMVTNIVPKPFASYGAYGFKSFPLDMSQFKNLFNSTRIPMQGKDRIEKFENQRHIVLMKKGNFYVFDLFNEEGELHTPERIHACVSHVFNDASPAAENPIGVLTALDRNQWATCRRLLWDAKNNEQLRLIDSAAFNLAFDDDVTVGLDPDQCFKTFLSGNTANRWFDKSFSIVMTADGMTAVNFEHAWGDGVAVMRYFNEIANEITHKSFVYHQSTPTDASHFVKKLEFNVPRQVADIIKKAQEDTEVTRNSLAVTALESDVLGRRLCKNARVSPDAVMQLGFQIGYHLQYGHAVSTYESCSTAAFKHGRTETLRPATIETKALCDALLRPQDKWPSKSELKDMVLKCSKVHANLTREAAMGKGFDRHLFGLKVTSERLNQPLHPLYSDVTHQKLNNHILSTSTLPSPEISIGGFAPVVQDGFGIGYRIQEDSLGMVASTYPPNRDGAAFIENVEKAYTIIADILKTK